MALLPVERRLTDLQLQWQDFCAHAYKRLLLWQVPDNAMRLVHAFFEVQRRDPSPETPYVGDGTFIVFDAAFDSSIQYSRALKMALAGHYEASRASFEQQGLAPDWHCEPAAHPDSATAFIQALGALAQRHEGALGNVVAVLLPAGVAHEPAWASWLQRALAAAEPSPGLRLVVLDSLDTPRLSGLAACGHPQLHVQAIPMDAWELAQETFAQEPAVGAAAVFRNVLAALFGLVDKGSPEQVMVKANDALAFARRQGWADQEAVVRMLAAGAMLKDGRFDEALRHYQSARTSAEKVVAANHPAGRQLVLQTWFAEASAHLASGNRVEAAHCYAQAEPVAQAIPNLILWIEALRMGAFCHAGHDDAAAKACATRALDVGERIKPEMRGLTTLPLAAFELLRLTDGARMAQVQALKHRLEADLAQLYEDTERELAALEQHSQAHGLLLSLERRQADHAEALERQAAQHAEALVAGGAPVFIALFERVQALLGPGWLLRAAPAQAITAGLGALHAGTVPETEAATS